jgi:D-alanyl-D-alanine carboxypeptidase (penicillin-binding protein 5/6)
MRNLRRVSAIIATVPLCAAYLSPLSPVAPAHGAVAAQPGPVGGPQLGSSGVVVDRSAGLRPPSLKASSYLIADGDTGEVLAAKDPHGKYLPASALKALTAIALIPRLDPEATVRPTRHTVNVEGSKVGMTPKLTYRVADLFKAALMVSGNDASLGLAQANGGVKRTLDAMNAEARRLQANDTRAGSPHGLDVDLGLTVKTQHTSAYDLALILRQGLKLPEFREYVGTVHARWKTLPTKKQRKRGKKTASYPLYSHDRLLPGEAYAYRGMIGGKNGYTNAARQTFVGAARRDGHTIIISLMHSETLWPYATRLLDWGFKARGRVKPVGNLVDPLPTGNAKRETGQRQNGLGEAENPLARANSGQEGQDGRSGRAGREDSGGWGTPLAGAALVVVVGGVAMLVLRRRRAVAAELPVRWDTDTPGRDQTGNVTVIERPTDDPGRQD